MLGNISRGTLQYGFFVTAKGEQDFDYVYRSDLLNASVLFQTVH